MSHTWIAFPKGAFPMGAQREDPLSASFDLDATEREAPPHRIDLEAFEMADFPVTVREYGAFVVAGGYDDESLWRAGGFGAHEAPLGWEAQSRSTDRPVVGVSWYEATAYAEFVGALLPTEAQWERAARGIVGRRFAFGEEVEGLTHMNSLEARFGGPSPRGAFPRAVSPEGIYDLSGNIWEWCQCRFGAYDLPVAPGAGERLVEDPAAPRVMRGGCFAARTVYNRAAFRSNARPEHRFDRRGFRLVRER